MVNTFQQKIGMAEKHRGDAHCHHTGEDELKAQCDANTYP